MSAADHIINQIAPEPQNTEEATAEATLRHAIASGIHWGSHSRAEQRRHGLPWIGGDEWTVHVAFQAADVYLAMALRALMEVSPERAEQFAQEVHYVNVSGEAGEVLWDMAAVHGVDAEAINEAASEPPAAPEVTP